jgi:hypothetical protein
MKTNGKGKQALSFHEAGTEIAQALAIPHQAAGMLLYGLAATGNVRTLDDELDPIDEDKCTSGLISALRVTRDPAKGDPGGEAPLAGLTSRATKISVLEITNANLLT